MQDKDSKSELARIVTNIEPFSKPSEPNGATQRCSQHTDPYGFASPLLQTFAYRHNWQQSGGNKTSRGYFATST